MKNIEKIKIQIDESINFEIIDNLQKYENNACIIRPRIELKKRRYIYELCNY